MNGAKFNYRKRKALGTVVVARANADHVIIARQFDPESGSEVTPHQESVSIAELEQQRAQLAETLAELDELIADLKGTKLDYFKMMADAAKGLGAPAEESGANGKPK